MATQTANFRIDPRSRLLGAGAHAIEVLLHGLEQGHSILTRQGAPIRTKADTRQRLFVQTSGSSGAPKMIRRSPESWIRSFDLAADLFGVTSADTYAILGDIGHSLSLFATMEALHIGADLACLSGLRPRSQLSGLTQHGVTTLYATPTQLRMLLSVSNGPILPDLKRLFVGGGSLDPALRNALSSAIPSADLREFFGASETSFITMADPTTPEGSVGKAYPGVTLRVAAPFETAEIWVRSPYLFDGYEQGETPDTQWDRDFLSVGELGYLDDAGNLFLRGRKSRMVTVADQNVFPDEVERVLLQQDTVLHAAVLALPDTQRGHVLVAMIQPNADLSKATLREACKKALGAASVPRRFILLARMPLLPAGKPDLQALQAQLRGMV
ncbi:ANL family adenylate-forming protein [Thalassovita sp.]|uniref:ANL family adenylate-forming protein n=1 Tax=Thalassovita sp. TaxID=1979401 RepID=UPI003B58EFBC